jgi:2-polyprenyl-6-methoxyphenol hydroxylase-like FAD-dependent oxidoreductase
VSLVTAPVERSTHVVVIGAGMGGLAAAHALSGYADRVTIVERDDLPSRPATRSGTPQGRHVHLLQPGGQAALERLLPGFGDELIAEGAIPVPAPGGILWHSPAGWIKPHSLKGKPVLCASRALIEWVTRTTVLSRSPIDVRTGVEVTGLAVTDDRVVGVDVRPRGAAAGEPTERLAADMVIDASGRRSHAPDWLAAAGYDRPTETSIDANLSYATRIFRRGPDDLGGWQAVFLQSKPPDGTRAGVLFPIEDDRWMLTLAGSDGDVPPTDENGFLDFARGMRSPMLAEAIERLEPVGPIVAYRRTANQRRHYESLRRAPDGLVVIGDAACAFNPVYGQGMSAAALTAEALERGVRDHVARTGGDLRGVTAGLQKAVARANAGAWKIATGQDLRWPGTTGGKESPVDRVMRRYLDRVVAASTVDPVVCRAFFSVVALLAEPQSLLRPSMMWRVLGHRHPAPPAEPPAPLVAPTEARAA